MILSFDELTIVVVDFVFELPQKVLFVVLSQNRFIFGGPVEIDLLS